MPLGGEKKNPDKVFFTGESKSMQSLKNHLKEKSSWTKIERRSSGGWDEARARVSSVCQIRR